jgi:hypothetical protein
MLELIGTLRLLLAIAVGLGALLPAVWAAGIAAASALRTE